MLFIPDNNTGFDFGINVEPLLKLNNVIVIYPTLGAIMSNHYFLGDGGNRSQTEFGFSCGLGIECYLSKRGFVNVDYKHYFIDKEKPSWYKDYGVLRVGYGFSF